MEFSNINWTDHTWNPWVGCRHVSVECDHCYADFLVSKRMGRDFGAVTRTKTWRDPIKWNARAPELQAKLGRRVRIFCASLTDFFIQDADEWRDEAWQVIRDCPNLDFLILTKRPALIPPRLPKDWGSGYRPMKDEWAMELRDRCSEHGVAFHFKQHSAFRPGTGSALQGVEYRESPLVQIVRNKEAL